MNARSGGGIRRAKCAASNDIVTFEGLFFITQVVVIIASHRLYNVYNKTFGQKKVPQYSPLCY